MTANGDETDSAESNAFLRALRVVVPVKRDELRSIAWSWLYFFSLLAGTFVLRPLRDSMGLNGGADKYPWLFTGTLIAMVVVSPPFALLVTKLPRKRFIPIVYRVSMACLLVFWLALTFMPQSLNLAAAYTFFVWFSVFNLFVVSVFRGFMADIWRLDQAKRLFGFIGVGGTVGALAGSKMASLLAKPIGSVNLIFLSIVLLEVAVFSVRRLVAIHRIDAAAPGEGARPPAALSTSDIWRGLQLIISQSYLRWIASYTFMYGLVGTFLYYQQGKLVDLTIHDRDLRTQYFANIEFWVQLGTVLIQFLLTARLIRWFGITFALISQPAIAVLGWIALALAMTYGSWLGTHGFTVGQLAPQLAVLAGVQIVLRISNFATAQPAREALYTVVEREVKYKSKSFVDTFIYRLGDCLGAWAFMGIQALGAGLTAIAVLTIPIAGVWVFVGRTLGRKQREIAEQAPITSSAVTGAINESALSR
jgi:ATP:ADP antiporter, AAA family